MNKRILTATLTALATFTIATLTRKGIRKLSANHPKFTVGDYVRITGVSTVYRIDGYSLTNETHTYHLEGTPETSQYAEDVLEAIADFETDLDDIEAELIVPLFDVGDTVQVHGSPEKYHVITAWPEMIYGLVDTETDEYIEMDEYVLKPVDGVINDEGITADRISEIKTEVAEMAKERKLTPREISNQEADKRKQARKERAAEIDNLLDIANWNRKQFEATGDEAFEEKERDQYEAIKKLQADI